MKVFGVVAMVVPAVGMPWPSMDEDKTCENYFGNVSGLVTVVDLDIGHTSVTEPWCDYVGHSSPCTFIHHAGTLAPCQTPSPPDGCHRYVKTTYDDTEDVVKALGKSFEVGIDADDLFSTTGQYAGAYKSLVSSVVKQEIFCFGPPAEDAVACKCPPPAPPTPPPPPPPTPTSGYRLRWKDCGNSSNHFNVTSVLPGIIAKHGTTTIHATGMQDVDADTVSWVYQSTLAGLFKKESHGDDLCQETTIPLPAGVGVVRFHDVSCPMKKGQVSMQFDLTLFDKDEWHPEAHTMLQGNGLLGAHMTTKLPNGEPVVCVDVEATLLDDDTVLV